MRQLAILSFLGVSFVLSALAASTARADLKSEIESDLRKSLAHFRQSLARFNAVDSQNTVETAILADLKDWYGIEIKQRYISQNSCEREFRFETNGSSAVREAKTEKMQTLLRLTYLKMAFEACSKDLPQTFDGSLNCEINSAQIQERIESQSNRFVSISEKGLAQAMVVTCQPSQAGNGASLVQKALEVQNAWAADRVAELENELSKREAIRESEKRKTAEMRAALKPLLLKKFRDLQKLQAEATELSKRQSQCEDKRQMQFNPVYQYRLHNIQNQGESCIDMSYEIARVLNQARAVWPSAFDGDAHPFDYPPLQVLDDAELSLDSCREIVSECESSTFGRTIEYWRDEGPGYIEGAKKAVKSAIEKAKK